LPKKARGKMEYKKGEGIMGKNSRKKGRGKDVVSNVLPPILD